MKNKKTPHMGYSCTEGKQRNVPFDSSWSQSGSVWAWSRIQQSLWNGDLSRDVEVTRVRRQLQFEVWLDFEKRFFLTGALTVFLGAVFVEMFLTGFFRCRVSVRFNSAALPWIKPMRHLTFKLHLLSAKCEFLMECFGLFHRIWDVWNISRHVHLQVFIIISNINLFTFTFTRVKLTTKWTKI